MTWVNNLKFLYIICAVSVLNYCIYLIYSTHNRPKKEPDDVDSPIEEYQNNPESEKIQSIEPEIIYQTKYIEEIVTVGPPITEKIYQTEEIDEIEDVAVTEKSFIDTEDHFFNDQINEEDYFQKLNHNHRVKNVLIVAEFRTGSTFFSEMFNQHPEVFYLYEPPIALGLGTYCPADDECTEFTKINRKLNDTVFNLKMRMIDDFWQCNLPYPEKFIDAEWLANAGMTLAETAASCLNHGFCNRGRNEKLINHFYCPSQRNEDRFLYEIEKYESFTKLNASEPQSTRYGSHGDTLGVKKNQASGEKKISELQLAKMGVTREEYEALQNNVKSRSKRKTRTECKKVEPSHAKKDCQNMKIRAMKVIRLSKLEHLNLINNNTNPNYLGREDLQILYLTRDPRGTANSRFDIRNTADRIENEKKKLPTVCDRFRENIEFLLSNNYKNVEIVRYEDVVLRPFEESSRILNLVGLERAQHLTQWYNLNMGFKMSSGAYGTAREDPIAAAFRWRSEMGWDNIDIVQNGCGRVLDRLGYSKLTPENYMDAGKYSTDPTWRDSRIYKELMNI